MNVSVIRSDKKDKPWGAVPTNRSVIQVAMRKQNVFAGHNLEVPLSADVADGRLLATVHSGELHLVNDSGIEERHKTGQKLSSQFKKRLYFMVKKAYIIMGGKGLFCFKRSVMKCE